MFLALGQNNFTHFIENPHVKLSITTTALHECKSGQQLATIDYASSIFPQQKNIVMYLSYKKLEDKLNG